MAKEWWKNYFGKEYVESYQATGRFKRTKQEVNFLEKAVPLTKTSKILDLCCGHGRHTIGLAKRGHHVWGLDFSRYELELARNAAKKANFQIDFRRGDARTFRYPFKFNVIINLFTAFGYGSQADDEKIIKRVSANLKTGGKFLLDVMSLPWLWCNYVARAKYRHGFYTILSTRKFDFWENQNVEIRETSYRGKKRIMKSTVRFYTLAELENLLARFNLQAVKVWGSFKGEPYNLNSKRMIVLAKKVG